MERSQHQRRVRSEEVSVIPAQAGTQKIGGIRVATARGSRLRGNDIAFRSNASRASQRGAALMFALVVMAILSVGTSVLWSQIHQNLSDQRRAWHREQAFQLAEAGLEHAIAALRTGQKAYTGDTDVPLGPGSFSVTVAPSGAPGSYLIEARGALDNAAYHYDRAALRATLHLSPSGKVDRYAWQPIKGES